MLAMSVLQRSDGTNTNTVNAFQIGIHILEFAVDLITMAYERLIIKNEARESGEDFETENRVFKVKLTLQRKKRFKGEKYRVV